MSMETDFFRRYRPVFAEMERAGFHRTGAVYQYEETFLDDQFRAELTIEEDGTVRGRVFDLDTGEEYLPIRAVHQSGSFVGAVREGYFEVLARVREACFESGEIPLSAWIIPSNPKIYDVDAGFAEGGGCIEWHQHNSIKAGDALFIYSAAPNSAILYRCEVEEAALGYHGMFRESKGYTRSMRIRLVDRYDKEQFPLSFMKEHGGAAVRSARRMPEQLLEAMRRKLEEE